MRIILKPAGLGIIVVIIAFLACLVFWGMPKPDKVGDTTAANPATTAKTNPQGVLLAQAVLVASPTDGSLKVRQETMPDAKNQTTVYAVSTDKPVADPWNVNLAIKVKDAVKKNESLIIVFWIRSAQPAIVTANFEETKEPFDKSGAQSINATTTWSTHTVPVLAVADYDPDGAQLTFHCGAQEGVVEIADVQLLHRK